MTCLGSSGVKGYELPRWVWSLPILFLSAKVRCTRMDKGRGAFRDVVFGVSRPERLSVVCVEEFREA